MKTTNAKTWYWQILTKVCALKSINYSALASDVIVHNLIEKVYMFMDITFL